MKVSYSKIRSVLLFAIFVFITANLKSQTAMPEELTKSPLRDQLNYLEEHTKIYENFRAIREDMFQRIKRNVNDTLSSTHKRIETQNITTTTLNKTIDSLNFTLETTKRNLDEITKSKDSIIFLGMEVEKGTYNTIMWSIIVVLLLILLIGFLIFNRNQSVINNRNKDLQDLKTEFEAYRKTSREAREKMVLQHFTELKKLKGE